MQGPAQYWYESGALQAEVHFNNGQADGPSRYWSENGQQLIEATYQEGQRVECSAWTQDGSPTECR
jgi:antitoxin component YwqK of YwqJK toxin-antitoxin module